VRWQLRGERVPSLPVVRGDLAYLPGRCAHRAGRPRLATACVPAVTVASGDERALVWAATGDAAPRGLGAGPGATVLWETFGAVVATDTRGREALRIDTTGIVRAVLAAGDQLAVATDSHLTLPGGAGATWPEPAARVALALTPQHVVVVRDDVLEARARADGDVAWTAPGAFTAAPGALVADGRGVRAIAIHPGVAPARVDEIGAVARGPGAPSLPSHVLAAAWADDGTLVVAVRLDRSLTRDAVVAFAADGTAAWVWPLPTPQDPRTDPIGLAPAPGGAVIFYDGRYVTRLAVGNPDSP